MKIEDYDELNSFAVGKWRIARYRHKLHPAFERLTIQENNEPARAMPITPKDTSESLFKSYSEMALLKKHSSILNTIAVQWRQANDANSFHAKASDQLDADKVLSDNPMFGMFG